MKIKSNLNKRESGTAIIEFAFVAFMFFLVIWGIFEYGRAFYVRNSSQHLTRCIARETVIRQPNAASATAAKQACLMPATGGFHYWPFYHTTPREMSNMFVTRYKLKSGSWILASDITGPAYNDQATLCAYGLDGCVLFVQVYVPAGEVLDMFSLLRTWIGSSQGVNEPFAATTMPAESMGYIP